MRLWLPLRESAWCVVPQVLRLGGVASFFWLRLFAPLSIVAAQKEAQVSAVFRCCKNPKTFQEAFTI
jgi:hypothetical protein